MNGIIFPILLLLLVSVVPADMLASTDALVRTESVADTVVLQEFSVTSIKQSDRLFDMPEAATVIGRAEAERLNAVAIKSLSDVVPNFYIPDYGSRITSSIYVRGIGARMDQPSVGLNVDNVPVLNKDAYDFDLADIASVEMLRGPADQHHHPFAVSLSGMEVSCRVLFSCQRQGVGRMVS